MKDLAISIFIIVSFVTIGFCLVFTGFEFENTYICHLSKDYCVDMRLSEDHCGFKTFEEARRAYPGNGIYTDETRECILKSK